MKKRTITISLIVLAFVLLFGIGYAGWVIASQTEATADGGNFSAYAVSSSTLSVTSLSTESITFGYKDSDPAVSNPWLTYVSVDAEDLYAEFTVTWADQVVNSEFTLTPSAYRANATDTPVELDSKLIAAPVFTVQSGNAEMSGGNLKLTAASGSAVVRITYNWGTSFGGNNPYIFFNGKTKTATPSESEKYVAGDTTYLALANSALSALNTLIGSGESVLKFKVVVAKAA